MVARICKCPAHLRSHFANYHPNSNIMCESLVSLHNTVLCSVAWRIYSTVKLEEMEIIWLTEHCSQ